MSTIDWLEPHLLCSGRAKIPELREKLFLVVLIHLPRYICLPLFSSAYALPSIIKIIWNIRVHLLSSNMLAVVSILLCHY